MKILVLAGLALMLAACGGGGGGGSAATGGGIALNITDAPVKDADIDEVWVRFTQVIVHPADGSGDIIVDVEDDSDPNDIKPYRDIELKSLVGGKTMLLGKIPLDAGDYSWIRLVIDPAHTHIVETSGGDYLVDCPSCTQSGFKLNRAFTIDATGWIDFTIDFDLRKSITLSQPNKPRDDFHYKLRPTLRILETALASSSISGEVTDQRSDMTNPPATPEGCWVYVYDGDAATIVPDDICLDPDTSVCPAADRPLLETQVMYDAVNNDGTYDYDTGYIYPGTYTIALVCEADDPDVDEDLLYIDVTEVFADAVAGGVTQDLVLSDRTRLTLAKTMANADEDGSGSVTVNDTLTYQLVAANAGDVTLSGVTVDDTLSGLGPLACDQTQPATLAPGELLTCTADYVVQAADEGTDIVNTATAYSDQTAPVTSSLTVPVAIAP